MLAPDYPRFKPLDWDDRESLMQALRDFPPEISEYTFTNLFAWRRTYGFEISRRESHWIVRSLTNGEHRYFYPLGPEPAVVIPDILQDDPGCQFIRLPESIRDRLPASDRLHLTLDPDNSDYLYAAQDLITLKGRKYSGKRNLIKQFKAAHRYDYQPLDAGHAHQCLEFEELWCTERECDRDAGLSHERMAVNDICGRFGDLPLCGGALWVEGRICGVAVGERLNPETLVVHILKAYSGLTGLYQTLMQEFLSREAAAYAWVNLEQDLGISGIRQAKTSYQPLRMINKYIAALT